MKTGARKALFRIHSWIGLQLGFLLFAVCFSGTLAVFSTELNWLADSALRVSPPAGANRESISWQEMYDRVAEAYPYATVVNLSAPPGERFVARAAIAYSPRDLRWVLIDPYTGTVQGQKSGFSLISFFRIFHKQLYIVPSVFGIHGLLLVGLLAVVLLSSAFSGLLSVKRWWRSFFLLRRRRSRQLFWSDFHRLTGVWALLVTLILSVTGIWYFTEQVLYDTGLLHERVGFTPAAKAETLGELPPLLPPLDLDQASVAAQAAFPELKISEVTLPVRFGDPLVFTGQAAAWLVRGQANQVQMNPYSGEILSIQRAEELTPFDRWRETADPLHFGTFAGLPGRIVWFVAGLAICGAIGAGLYGAWLRLYEKSGRPKTANAAALAAIVPALALIGFSAYGVWSFGGEALNPARQPVSVTPLAETALGPWSLSILRFDGGARRSSSGIVVLFDGTAQANFGRAQLWLEEAEKPPVALASFRFADRLLARAPCARAGTPVCRLRLQLDEWNGTQHRLTVDLRPRETGSPSRQLPMASGITTGEYIVLALFALSLLAPFLGWSALLLRRA